MSTAASPLEKANQIAEGLLFPSALATDAGDVVPVGHLDALAAAGFYGLAAPAEAGGMGVGEATARQVIEILAGGCLTTTFVWIQHHGAVRAVLEAPPAVRDEWLVPMSQGQRRAGIAVAGIRPGATALTAHAVEGGWLLRGVVPWVTGWTRIDVLHAAARNQAGDIVWALVDAAEAPTLSVTRTHLVAVNASATVMARFRDHFVPAHRVTGVENYQRWQDRDAASLRTNGSLALGVAGRCCRLLGPSHHDDELTECRAELDRATAETVPAARASASHLAMRTAATLIAAAGSRSILMDHHGQRLGREAMFLLVFASRPAIRTDLVQRLERPGR
jgi:alkylation response protein AidB-like acyl-CoA dehydrogenase